MYPIVGEETVAWREGIEMARKSARYVGMGPTSFSGNIDLEEDSTYADQLWFFEPLKRCGQCSG